MDDPKYASQMLYNQWKLVDNNGSDDGNMSSVLPVSLQEKWSVVKKFVINIICNQRY